MARHNTYRPFTVRRKEKNAKNKVLLTSIFIIIFLYISITWLLPTLIGGLSVLNKFKPVQKSDNSFIEDSSIAPPVLNIPFEATNSAQIKISGYAQPDTQVEIYIDDELQTTTTVNSDGNFSSDLIDLRLGTNSISGKTIDKDTRKSLPSKIIRIIYDNQKPSLVVHAPSDNQETKDKRFTVTGITNPDETIEITINNNRTVVNTDGNFSYSVELNEGDNNIVIVAVDQAGNSTQLSRKLIYRP